MPPLSRRSYFFAYEALMQRHLRQTGLRREDVSPGFAVLYGAAAGYALWATIYPFDGASPTPASIVCRDLTL